MHILELGCLFITPQSNNPPKVTVWHCIRESVDSLCRDDADIPMPPYIQKAYNCLNTVFISLFRQLTMILECFSTS